MRATNVNLPGVGLGFLACDGSSLDDTVHVVVRFSTQALHWRGRGWLVGNECNGDFSLLERLLTGSRLTTLKIAMGT